jgi:choline dehydrogenase-like flavoprotein
LTVLLRKHEETQIPTIAIIGGGTGGNLLAAALLERAASGQRLNVMLIEARGRAGPQLRRIVRQAEGMAPGGFLTRLRGEAVHIDDAPAAGTVRVTLRSGRVLDIDRAVVVHGSVAAAALPPGTPVGSRVHSIPSEGEPDAMRPPLDSLAAGLVDELATAGRVSAA